MPDDLTDAQTEVQSIQGIENHPYGYIIIRLYRLLAAARAKFATDDSRLDALESRMTALEARVTKLGG